MTTDLRESKYYTLIYGINEKNYRDVAKYVYLNLTKLYIQDFDISDYKEPLKEASYSNQSKIIKYLSRKVNDLNFARGIVLIQGVKNRDLKLTEFLLSRGADPNQVDINVYRDPLLLAIENHDIPMIKLLLKYRPNLHVGNLRGLISNLLYENQVDIFKLIIEHDNTYSESHNTKSLVFKYQDTMRRELYRIFDFNTLKYVLSLLNQTNDKSHFSQALVEYTNTVYIQPRLNFIKLLIEYGADPNYERGKALIGLIMQGQLNNLGNVPYPGYKIEQIRDETYSILNYLIQHGARMKPVDSIRLNNYQVTPLVAGIWTGSPTMVSYILKYQVDVNRNDGEALKQALRGYVAYSYDRYNEEKKNYYDIIQLLIDYGADSSWNSTIDGIISYTRDEKLRDLLFKYGKLYDRIVNGKIEEVIDILKTNPIINYYRLKTINITNPDIIRILNSYLQGQNEALYSAITQNNVRAVRKLLESRMTVDYNRLTSLNITSQEILSLVNDQLRKQDML
jgi:ankyrin repeat protein